MLDLNNISKKYPGFSLSNISFTVDHGDYFVLLGSSGSGKSMLLEIIAGISVPGSGKITLDGKDITYENIQNRNIAHVHQDQNLFPHLSVFNNIAYALRNRKMSSADIEERVHKLAETVDVKGLLSRKPLTLSGGEAQRVALARALAISPKCLLLDEPLSNVDSQLRNDLRALLRNINIQGQTIVHVTHDYEEAISLASRIAVLENGIIAQCGLPEEIFQFPKSEFVAKFIGVKNFYKGNLLPVRSGSMLRCFETDGPVINVSSEQKKGKGFVLIPAESIVISGSHNNNSSRNSFEGIIMDIFPNRNGLEVVVDIGVSITSIISKEAAENLCLEKNKKIWISFKATSAKFIEI